MLNAVIFDLDEFLLDKETIRLMKDLYRNNIKLALTSSTTINEMKEQVNRLNIQTYVTTIVSSVSVEYSKPELFLITTTQLDEDPRDCLIVTATMNGTIAASQSNITCIGYQHSNQQNLSKAYSIIESMDYIDYSFLLNEYLHAHGLPVTIAKTDRLIIRELSMEDIKTFYNLYQTPENSQYLPKLDDLQQELEKHQAYIQYGYCFFGYGLWGVFLKENNQLIGRCGIQNTEINDEIYVELGYLIDHTFTRQGYATEAVTAIIAYAKEQLLFDSLVAFIAKDNLASIQFAKSLGFTRQDELIYHGFPCYFYRLELSQ